MNELTPLDQLGRQEHCLNCGADRSEIFCQRCGQKHVERRLSVKSLIRELPSRLFSLDRGFLHTVIQLWKSPGVVAKNYVHGQRKRYATPLTMFLVAASMQLVVLKLIEPQLREIIYDQFETAATAHPDQNPLEPFVKIFGDQTYEKLTSIYVATINQAYTYVAFLFFCLPFAALLRLLRRGDPHPYRLGEHLTFVVYTLSQLLICTAFANLITIRTNSTIQMVVNLLLYFGYTIIAHRAFYERGAASLVKTVLAFAISIGIFLLSIGGVFGISAAFHIVRDKLAAG